MISNKKELLNALSPWIPSMVGEKGEERASTLFSDIDSDRALEINKEVIDNLARETFQTRLDAIAKHGFSIKTRIMGPRGYTDSYSYSLYYNNIEVFYGAFDSRTTLVKEAEECIKTGVMRKWHTPRDEFLQAWDNRKEKTL